LIVFIYFPDCEESAGQSALDDLAEMLIFAFKCGRIFSGAEMKI